MCLGRLKFFELSVNFYQNMLPIHDLIKRYFLILFHSLLVTLTKLYHSFCNGIKDVYIYTHLSCWCGDSYFANVADSSEHTSFNLLMVFFKHFCITSICRFDVISVSFVILQLRYRKFHSIHYSAPYLLFYFNVSHTVFLKDKNLDHQKTAFQLLFECSSIWTKWRFLRRVEITKVLSVEIRFFELDILLPVSDWSVFHARTLKLARLRLSYPSLHDSVGDQWMHRDDWERPDVWKRQVLCSSRELIPGEREVLRNYTDRLSVLFKLQVAVKLCTSYRSRFGVNEGSLR